MYSWCLLLTTWLTFEPVEIRDFFVLIMSKKSSPSIPAAWILINPSSHLPLIDWYHNYNSNNNSNVLNIHTRIPNHTTTAKNGVHTSNGNNNLTWTEWQWVQCLNCCWLPISCKSQSSTSKSSLVDHYLHLLRCLYFRHKRRHYHGRNSEFDWLANGNSGKNSLLHELQENRTSPSCVCAHEQRWLVHFELDLQSVANADVESLSGGQVKDAAQRVSTSQSSARVWVWHSGNLFDAIAVASNDLWQAHWTQARLFLSRSGE